MTKTKTASNTASQTPAINELLEAAQQAELLKRQELLEQRDAGFSQAMSDLRIVVNALQSQRSALEGPHLLETLERSSPSGDVGSLRVELQDLRAAVHAVQARDQVILEDLTPTTHENLVTLVYIENLIDDEDSPTTTPTYTMGKRK
ncbi:hypothetical protein K7X08_020872 [Anisodus acutangulus]|uniref:Uncharacterized protein n=1 Tax=Anisodus acutangulus TaxID=402998 RepID=A0A9Q1MTA5_9SOLA|nr:hypothetical protein K7X08_020872 [Anisodus acutangulus]